MQLNIKQRLVLLNTLPNDGQDIHMLRVIHDLRQRLAFQEEELVEFKVEQVAEGRLTWDAEADRAVDIDIGPKAFVFIQDRLKALSDQKKLTMDHLDLWDLFECDKGA